MHHLMVTSAVYRQASRPTNRRWPASVRPAAAENWKRGRSIDPANDLLWRQNRRRLEGEAIRDAMLAASKSLSQRRGGPGVRPPLPKELLVTLLKNQWPVTPDKEDHDRRSIYLFVRRNLRYPIFRAFDKPDMNQSCPRRNRSTIAPQALMLLNSELSLSAAGRLAGFLIEQAGNDRSRQIELCFLRTLGRPPTAAERRTSLEFLAGTASRLKSENRPAAELALPDRVPASSDSYQAAALTDFCLAVFNLNEFIYVD